MPKITQTKVGSIYIREIEPRKWRASWIDPLTKRHLRRILPAATFEEARAQAKEINAAIAQGKGFGGRVRGRVGHTFSDAVVEAVQHSQARERTKRDYLSRFNPFGEYLRTHVPGVKSWADITPAILENYIRHSRAQGIAHDTLKSRLFVLRLTGAYMARTYGNPNPTESLRLRRSDPPRSEIEAKDSILSPAQYREFLRWLEAEAPMVRVWAVLQGMCGMRMLEAAYLREQDFDPVARTITITENPAHKPKNRPSYRTIPICPEAAEVLSAWIAGLKVRHESGFLFVPSRMKASRAHAITPEARAGALTLDRVSHLWARALLSARLSGLKLPAAFQPRKLRASFVTALREAGADVEVLQRYIGHSSGTVLGAHYEKIDLARLRVVPDLAERAFSGSEVRLKTGGVLQ